MSKPEIPLTVHPAKISWADGPFERTEHTPGMLLRDYFAARAPLDVPNWFKTEPTPRPAFPTPPPLIEKTARQWLRDDAGADLESFLGESPLPAAVEAAMRFQEEVELWRENDAMLRERDALDRLAAWGWAYADAMLARRNRTP